MAILARGHKDLVCQVSKRLYDVNGNVLLITGPRGFCRIATIPPAKGTTAKEPG
jgi:hypothetical protein